MSATTTVSRSRLCTNHAGVLFEGNAGAARPAPVQLAANGVLPALVGIVIACQHLVWGVPFGARRTCECPTRGISLYPGSISSWR